MPDTVDEKSWRSVYSAANAAQEMLSNDGGVDSFSQLAYELLDIEAERRCVTGQMDILKRVLMLEQHIVHFPECTLRSRGFGCFGRVRGVRMDLRQRKVPKY